MRGGCRPLCTPHERALRPAPRPTFFRKESRQRFAGGKPPGPPEGDAIAPPAASRTPSKGESATDTDGVATLRWWGKLDAPSPWALSKRNILLSIRGAGAFSCTFGCNFGGIRGIGEGGFFETNRKRSGGNGGDGRRLNPIMSRTRNNLFIKFTASLEFVSGWFPVRFRLRFRNKWLNYAIYQPYGNEKLLFLLKKDL